MCNSIIGRNVFINGHRFDFKLKDGTLLHATEWNGEKYVVGHGKSEREFSPVYSERVNENGGYDIIDFN